MRKQNLIIDCDDTLWENNRYFIEAHDKFLDMMEARGHDRSRADELLIRLEMDNVPRYGYGSRSQALSMADVYRMLEDEPDEGVLASIDEIGREVFSHPINLLPGVAETLPKLFERYRMIILTKGDHEEQSGKIEKSPVREYFSHYKVVPEKGPDVFREVLREFGMGAGDTWAIGDSPRSDILPAVANGVRSVFIPFEMTWQIEHQELPESELIFTVESFGHLDGLLL